MRYRGFSNDELRQAIDDLEHDAPPPGSPADAARTAALAELHRRQLIRRPAS